MGQETEARKLLDATVDRAIVAVNRISTAFREPWSNDPGTGVRVVFGVWANKAVRHLGAILVLVKNEELALLAEVHYRQMLEILFQVRHLASTSPQEREVLAEKISAWGCLDWLSKMEPLKERQFATVAYKEMSEQLARYDPNLISQIKKQRSQGKWYWFGMSPTKLAGTVSRRDEDLERLYHITSAHLHGAWDVALGVTNPEPGLLDFRAYPDKATLYHWATESVDRATQLCIQIWNEIASATGAPLVSIQEVAC